MLSRRRIFTTLFKLNNPINTTYRSWRFSSNTRQASSNFFLIASKNIMYGTLALLAGVGGINYAAAADQAEKGQQIPQKDGPLTKKDVKHLIQQAKDLEEQGRNAEAVALYRKIYSVYIRAQKASIKKLVFITQRLGVLKALEGKYERAVDFLTESFERSAKLPDHTDDIHFELYYDLSLMKYKFEEYYESSVMLSNCLELAEFSYSEEYDLLASIHQYIGFGHYKRGDIKKGEEHLTKALGYVNRVKKENKQFVYYFCKEFFEFFTSGGDFKKGLLFLEQARILLEQENFFSQEMKDKGMKIRSAYVRKYMQDIKKDVELDKLNSITGILYKELGDYDRVEKRKNQPSHKLPKQEKNFDVHGLLRW